MSRLHHARLGRTRGRSGLLLLELVIALAVFVAIGTVIFATVRQALLSIESTRDLLRADDFASSVLALLESSIETAESMNGPLPEWSDAEGYFGGAVTGGAAMGFASALEEWEVEIDTAPAGVAGFTSVTVTVRRADREGIVAIRESLLEFETGAARGGGR